MVRKKVLKEKKRTRKTTLLFYSMEHFPLSAVLNQTQKKRPREISVDSPVKRTRITHYCQHNHSMKREGAGKEAEPRTRDTKPQTLQNIWTAGVKIKHKGKLSRKERSKWVLRQCGWPEHEKDSRLAYGGLGCALYCCWQECRKM